MELEGASVTDEDSAAPLSYVFNIGKTGWLSRIQALPGGVFRFMGSTFSLEALLQRPSLRANGITAEDIAALEGGYGFA